MPEIKMPDTYSLCQQAGFDCISDVPHIAGERQQQSPAELSNLYQSLRRGWAPISSSYPVIEACVGKPTLSYDGALSPSVRAWLIGYFMFWEASRRLGRLESASFTWLRWADTYSPDDELDMAECGLMLPCTIDIQSSILDELDKGVRHESPPENRKRSRGDPPLPPFANVGSAKPLKNQRKCQRQLEELSKLIEPLESAVSWMDLVLACSRRGKDAFAQDEYRQMIKAIDEANDALSRYFPDIAPYLDVFEWQRAKLIIQKSRLDSPRLSGSEKGDRLSHDAKIQSVEEFSKALYQHLRLLKECLRRFEETIQEVSHNDSTRSETPTPETSPSNFFCRNVDGWEIRYHGRKPFRINALDGVFYLHCLIRDQGKSTTAAVDRQASTACARLR